MQSVINEGWIFIQQLLKYSHYEDNKIDFLIKKWKYFAVYQLLICFIHISSYFKFSLLVLVICLEQAYFLSVCRMCV